MWIKYLTKPLHLGMIWWFFGSLSGWLPAHNPKEDGMSRDVSGDNIGRFGEPNDSCLTCMEHYLKSKTLGDKPAEDADESGGKTNMPKGDGPSE